MKITNTNFTHITENNLAQLIKAGQATLIKQRIVRGIVKNEYFDIGDNAVLLRVCGDNFVMLNHYITSNGCIVDLVKELSQFTWSLLENENHKHRARNPVVTIQQRYSNLPKRNYLHRMIMHLYCFGSLNTGRLDAQYDVHHIRYVFDNRIKYLQYIDKRQHLDRHSHMFGYVIKTIKGFMDFKSDMGVE